MGNPITATLIEQTCRYIPDVQPADAGTRPAGERPWQKWLDATLGLRDYWYPVELTRNLGEGASRVVTPLGEEILLMRRNGRVHAIENRCCHRGARLSEKPLCLSDDTVTCWVHTFTYSLEDGSIRTILNMPDSKLVGRPGIKVYPVEEVKGLIFVFIGDIAPPPLAQDVPPGFLDEDNAVYVAEIDIVHSNWRIGCEGSFDPAHHFIHNWSTFAVDNRLPMSLGWVPDLDRLADVIQYAAPQDGPKGFTRCASDTAMRFDTTIPGRGETPDTHYTVPMARGLSEERLRELQEHDFEIDVALWLPCGTRISPWPSPGVSTGEFFVPRDANSHYYVQYGCRKVGSEAERKAWESGELGVPLWKVPNVDGFTKEDIEAREAIAKFYDAESGWDREVLMGCDLELLMWRRFASEHARGPVQQEKHVQGRFRKQAPCAAASNLNQA
ncbi:Rieske 2Fe-2S domain-containing protein [Paraburkholderia sp. J63]|uniref:Rieske 2Fe-2S domain-containing protein n=1 Tax=Paraburkholderia sp. J63 TaxID=2805434 RepID=UPI002ABE5B96|nr:Rieske 2Fe-2S domain-containing protein [Paraburkholderia sp. J63]